jgi:hypothetical protein
MIMVILGLDPGIVNYGYCFTEEKTPIKCGMLNVPKNPKIIDMLEYSRNIMDLILFSDINTALLDKIIIERFQPRGGKISSIELLNFHFGDLHARIQQEIPTCEIEFVTAAAWKNKIKPITDIKTLEKTKGVTAHIVDSYLISTKDWIKSTSIDELINNVNLLTEVKNYG